MGLIASNLKWVSSTKAGVEELMEEKPLKWSSLILLNCRKLLDGFLQKESL